MAEDDAQAELMMAMARAGELNAISTTEEKLRSTTDVVRPCPSCDNPSICFSVHLARSGTDRLACSSSDYVKATVGFAYYACEAGHTTTTTDFICGTARRCSCPVVWPLLQFPRLNNVTSLPDTPRILVVSGFQYDDLDGPYSSKLNDYLADRGVDFEFMNADLQDGVLQKLRRGDYSKIIFLNLDDACWSGEKRMRYMFERGNILLLLLPWIKDGGKFIITGCGTGVEVLLQVLLNKFWHFCGDFYRRSKQKPNRFNPAAAHLAELSESITIQATMLSGVSREDQLYAPAAGARSISDVPNFHDVPVPDTRTAVAATKLGEGIVCYIGDEDGDLQTLDLIASL